MGKCLECGKEVPQTPKKRAAKFCNSTCRSKHWFKQKRKNKPHKIPANVVSKPVQEPKAPLKEDRDKRPPITIADLKAMCPPELSGLDRTIWISENRKKYGI